MLERCVHPELTQFPITFFAQTDADGNMAKELHFPINLNSHKISNRGSVCESY